MKKLTILFISLSFFSCKTLKSDISFSKVTIDTLFTDKISIRAISVSNNKVWYAADKNRIGVKGLTDKLKNEKKIIKDSLQFEFRSIAQTKHSIFAITIGNPALLYKFSKDLSTEKIVYQEDNEKVFYDAINFWNDNVGIAIGDPIGNCLSIIITRDGGETWNKIPCENLPKIIDGEAAFAASNTNINIQVHNTWVATGGKKARIFFSPDKGISWKIYETPIVQGETMTGIFAADFYDENIGIVAGGNYEKPNQNFQNKAITSDGGKTWNLVGENQGPGYISCVQFVPNSKGNKLVTVGANGVFYSKDKGTNWQQLSTDGSFFTIRFVDYKTAVAAGKNKMVLLKFSE